MKFLSFIFLTFVYVNLHFGKILSASTDYSVSLNVTDCEMDVENKEEARSLFTTFQDRLLKLMSWSPNVPVLGNIYEVDVCTFDHPQNGSQRGFKVHFLLVKSLCKRVSLRPSTTLESYNCNPKNYLQSAPVFSCMAVIFPSEYFFNPENCLIEQIYDSSD